MLPMSRLMKIPEFTYDQSDQLIVLKEKCGLTGSWNNPKKDIARKTASRTAYF